MEDVAFILLIVVGFLIVFPLFWSAVVYFISLLGGWSQLKHVYRHDLPFNGEKTGFVSGRIGRLGNYNGVLTIGRDYDGLYLSTLFMYRPGHPPLLIPWEDISMEEGKVLFTQYTEMTFARLPTVKVRIYRYTPDWFRDYQS